MSESLDRAERVTNTRSGTMSTEIAALTDQDVVCGWLRELTPDRDQQVFVHRPWGTIVAVADRRETVSVFFSDGEHSWYAVAPGTKDNDLTAHQIEAVLIDALTSPSRPAYPTWRSLT